MVSYENCDVNFKYQRTLLLPLFFFYSNLKIQFCLKEKYFQVIFVSHEPKTVQFTKMKYLTFNNEYET